LLFPCYFVKYVSLGLRTPAGNYPRKQNDPAA
jgi:hypothetical protein